jgi:EAL domain-containing protein (putative c-di-GMP-specific phosphodiesterase class I)
MVKFVDKSSVYEKIKEIKPDYIQGFIISKPKSLKQILETIKGK